ncbi:hypothetical protein MKW98_000601 [Papaver atlanticum]|uniref:Uncharacterized protein n=1 Tax=Papaver atlanticum TaxID=357466 RepID=A0AAD4S5G7_9MAGN|nr:hypothetical protein MKW98_000601 [Papaver atlanticum]
MDRFIRNLRMNGGTGKTSYSFNSTVQERAIYVTKPLIEEAALDVFSKFYACSATLSPTENISDGPNKGLKPGIGIADLGCSSGPNTLLVISYLLNIIYNKCREFDSASPEIVMFLNDLPGIDFNTLFKHLESFSDELKRTKGDGFGPCFAAGMNTLHFVHSSYSLQWLSQVPQGIESSNKGNIYISKSSPPFITEAYFKQFTSDFKRFLNCRSEELVKGGKIVVTLLGRRNADPTSLECCYFWELLALALNDMVSEGIIEEEKLMSFNLPQYMPSNEEVKNEIQCEGSFMINQLEAFQVNWDGSHEDDSSEIDSYKAASCIRAVSESLLMNHFGIGEEIVDKLFHMYMTIVANNVPKGKAKFTNIVMSLTKV